VLLAAVRPTQWQLQHSFHGTAALLQLADGISGLNDIDIDVDVEASQVESSPVCHVTMHTVEKGRHVLGMLSRTGSSAGISSLHPNAQLSFSFSQPAVELRREPRCLILPFLHK
jgi:hypothetical protein